MHGALRFLGSFNNEMKDNVFAYVSTHASRAISLRVFTHVMDLSLKFHIGRKTGAVIRSGFSSATGSCDWSRLYD